MPDGQRRQSRRETGLLPISAAAGAANSRQKKNKRGCIAPSFLVQQHIEYQHQAEADQKHIGCAALRAVSVGFGDHFVADDV